MAKLIRIDKNGTKYYEETECPKCGGNGYIDAYAYIDRGVCYLCGGSGYHVTHWKEMTPEYTEKLRQKRLAKARKEAPAKNAKFLKKEGFSADGRTWIVLGNTYEIKDDLKAAGCRWHNLLGWHFDHADNGFNCFELSVDEVTSLSYADEYIWNAYSDVEEYVKEKRAALAPKSTSEYVGEIGDKIEAKLTFKSEHHFETHYTYYGELNFIYKFADQDGNIIVWKTTKCFDLKEGEEYTVKGKIKDHNEYKGEKQTILTRCKIEGGKEI